MADARVAVYHDLPSGGAKRALREQVKGLRQLGYRVDAFVPSTADENFLPLAEVADGVEIIQRPAAPDRERALEGSLSPFEPVRWLGYLARVRRTERAAAARIDAGHYDAVLVGASQFTQAPWLLRDLRTPSVYYCQEPLRAAYEPRIAPPLVRFGIRHTLGRVDRRNARAATLLAVNSRFSAERIRAVYGVEPSVNYLAVDIDHFRPVEIERSDFVLTVAALHPLKGIDFLLEALASIPQAERPRLVVVSDRSRAAERRRVEVGAARLAVNVELHSRVTEENLVRAYNQARLVVYAPYDEPFGFVPLEAMACGRPVLGVREGGIPETVVEGETGFLAVRDPVQFGARVHELLRNPALAEEIAARSRSLVRQRWSWSRSVEELAGLLEQIATYGRSA